MSISKKNATEKRVDSTVDVNKAETKKAKNVNSKKIEVSQGSDKSEIQLVEKSVKARHEDEVSMDSDQSVDEEFQSKSPSQSQPNTKMFVNFCYI